MIAPSPLLLAQADSARAIASVYTMSLLATLPIALAAIAAFVFRRATAEARSLIWRSALVALLVVFIGRQLPLHWIAWVVPSLLAAPLVALGRLQVNAGSMQSGPVEDVPIFITALFAVYLAGVLAVLTPIVVGSFATRRRLRSSTEVSGAGWSSAIDDVSRHFGITRPIRVFIAPSALVPMTWGFVRPVVVLPIAAIGWDDRERRIVLMHELAHVRAGDWLFNMIARVVCALLWFHPGAWWLARGLRDDCELACDDRVIASGVRRSDYAEVLVNAADALPKGDLEPAAALALSRHRGLRQRIAAVLDVKHDVRPLARGWGAVAVVLTLGVGAPTSLVQLAPTRDVLTGLMRDAQWQSRAYAVLGLARRADSVAVARSAAERDPNPRVRAWARYALSLSPAEPPRSADVHDQ